MFSEIRQTKNNFCDLKSTLNKDQFLQYFVIQPYIFMLVKCLVQLQFCLDKADKPQVMFYFPEIKET